MATSTAQAIATVPVWDYLMATGSPSSSSPKGLAGKTVKVSLTYSLGQSVSPVTALSVDSVVTETDGNGFWQVNLVPNNKVSPAGTLYKVEIEGYRSYVIQVTDVGAPGIGWQSSAIAVLPPISGAVGYTLPGGTSVLGGFTIAVGEPGLDVNSPGPLLIGDNVATSIEMGSGTTVVYVQGSIQQGKLFDLGGAEFNIQNYGAITAITDIGPLVNSAIVAANAAGGGRVKLPVPPTAAGFQLATTVVPMSNVEVVGAFGTLIKWVGATSGFMIASNPTAGNNVSRFGMRGLVLDAGSINGVCPILLNSWQYGFLENITLQNVSGSGTAALRMETAVGTGSENNTVGNRISRLQLVNIPIGIQFYSPGGGPGVTNNWFDHVYMGGGSNGLLGPTQIGVNMVQNCDSNMFSYVEIILQASNAIGVVFNNSVTPAASAGVFNERFYHLDVSVFSGAINCTGVKLNYASQVFIEDLYHSPIAFPGTLIDATNFNPALNSAWIVNAQEPSTNHMDVLGSNIKWDTTGTFPLAPANSLQFGSSAAAGNPSLTAWGSDTNINMDVKGKGSGAIFLASQNHNFLQASGGATLSTPTLAGLGDTNTNLGLQGTGTGVVFVAAHRANFLQIAGANSLGNVALTPIGGDTNIGLDLQGKGSGPIRLGNQFANFMQVQGAAAASAPSLQVAGSDTNIDAVILAKGTGMQNLGPAGARLRVDSFGHLISDSTGTPTTSNLGANVTSAIFTGNDIRGTIAIVMSGGLAANTRVCTATFANSYGATAPKVTLVDQTSAVGLTIVNSYVLSQSTGVSFDIAFDQALAAGTYTLDYIVIG